MADVRALVITSHCSIGVCGSDTDERSRPNGLLLKDICGLRYRGVRSRGDKSG